MCECFNVGLRYMDAEIGVRNLADSFRYNTLPDVAKALGFDIENYKKNPEYAEIEAMEDLPDYEQLVWMVRSLPNPSPFVPHECHANKT